MQQDSDWRSKRRSGMAAIAAGFAGAAALGAAVYFLAPTPSEFATLESRMLFAVKCFAAATLFCLVTGVEAVAHERLQSPAFDPLDNYQNRRLRVNLRYLQNTLEQTVIFAAAVFGFAAYATSEARMRLLLAAVVVWVAARFAFWIGYHRSAAMRGLGAPGMLVSFGLLLYVGWRIGIDTIGPAGGIAVIAAFLAIEALLFRTTRAKTDGQSS
jgi:hypothetical protein